MKHNLLLLSMIVSIGTYAQKPSDEISQGFKKIAPMRNISAAKQTPIKGLTQITLDSGNVDDIYYMTNDGKYIITGDIIEVESRKNLTQKSKTGKIKEIVSQFGTDKRIDFFPQEMKHHVTVYTDIDCGYCRKLHNNMKNYNDLGIGISYLMWPRSGIGSVSYNKAVTAWCAVDKKDAMTRSQKGEVLKPMQCDNPIKQQFLSGIQIGVKGTPNIVTDQGVLIPTYMPADALLQRLEMIAASQ